jgi:hypothetical protein
MNRRHFFGLALGAVAVRPSSTETASPTSGQALWMCDEAADEAAVFVSRPGWCTFMVAVLEGEYPESVGIADQGGAPMVSQCDVKARWIDRSVKEAIVTFKAPRVGPYRLVRADTPWLQGPLVNERREQTATGGRDVRTYQDGYAWIDQWEDDPVRRLRYRRRVE